MRLHDLYHHRDRPNITNRDLAEFLLFIYGELTMKLQDLQQAVADERTVVDSAVTLINGIAQRIEDAGGDPDAITALVSEVRNQASALAAAVSVNTPTPTEGS